MSDALQMRRLLVRSAMYIWRRITRRWKAAVPGPSGGGGEGVMEESALIKTLFIPRLD